VKSCRECHHEISEEALMCPQCGAPYPARESWDGWGYEYKSPLTIAGLPLVHISFKYRPNRRPVVARGIIAIGQFGCGVICISQLGIGVVSISQFTVGSICDRAVCGSVLADRAIRFVLGGRPWAAGVQPRKTASGPLTIVGGTLNRWLVTRRGRGRDCAPAALD
jgi:hypothetical protein